MKRPNAAHSLHLLTTRFLRELTSQVEVTEDNVSRSILNGKSAVLIKGHRYPLSQVTRDPAGDIVFEIAVAGQLVKSRSKPLG